MELAKHKSSVLPLALGILAAALGGVMALLTSRSVELFVVPFVLTALVAVAILVYECSFRDLQPVSPLFFVTVAYTIMFALVPIADLANSHPLTSHSGWWVTSWYSFTGLLLIYVGYLLGVRLGVARPGKSTIRQGWDRARGSLSAGLLFVLAVTAFAVLLRNFGGVAVYLSAFQQRTLLFRPYLPLIVVSVGFALPALMIKLGNWIVSPTFSQMVRIMVLWIPATLVLTGFFGARYRALGIVVAVAAAYHLGVRRMRFLVMVAGGLILIAIFVLAGVRRESVGTRGAPAPFQITELYGRYLVKHDFAQFRDFLLVVEAVPERLPFQYGKTLLAAVPYVPVPTGGAVFSSKFFPELYVSGTSLSPSLPGELFMNFGAPGLFIGMVFFGAVLGGVEAYYRRHPDDVGALLIYAFSIVPLLMELRGDFAAMTQFYLTGLIPLWVAIRFSRSRQEMPSPRGRQRVKHSGFTDLQ